MEQRLAEASRSPLSTMFRYALPVLFVAAATAARWGLPGLFSPAAYLAYYPAVIAAAVFCGFGPGLLAALLSTLCVDMLFTSPFGQVSIDPQQWGRQAIFLVSGIGVSLFAELRRQERLRQRQHEGKLQESESKYRIVAEHTHDWEFWLAPDGRFLYTSPACQKVTGYSADEFLADQNLVDRIVHPDDQAHYQEHRRTVSEGHISEEIEYRIIRRDGETRWIGHGCVPVYDDDGVCLGVRGSNRDITDRKRFEEALRNNQQRHRGEAEELEAIMDAAPGGICVAHDPDCHRMTGNRLAYELLGVPPGGNISATPEERAFDAPVHFSMYAQGRKLDASELPLQLVCTTGITVRNQELEVVHHDGSRHVILLNAAPLRSAEGAVRGAVAAFVDITERKRAEEALRESEVHYRTLFSSIDEGFCIIEMIFDESGKPMDYRFLETNPSFEKQTGLVNARGKRMRDLAPQHEEHWFETYGRIALTGEPARFQHEAAQLHRWYDVYAFRFGAAKDRQVAILFSDVTDRRRDAESLAAAKVSAERARAAAEHASRAKDHFMAVLSHELRNPLNPVLATATMLQRDPRFDADTLEQLEIIRRNAELEARLIDDLLDVTRISRGKVELNRRKIELCTILQHAVQVCQPDINARALHFSLQIQNPPHFVDADPGRLQQVFWNLIKNAVKFTPHGGCVGVRAWREQDQALIEVSDSGVGIEPEALTRIFNAFEQAESSTVRQFGGLGLGLAISKALVDLHGGTIRAHSEGKGKGARFIVHLPLVLTPPRQSPATSASPSAIATPPALAPATTAPAPGLRILLVEDHGDTANIMSRVLRAAGHTVHAAGDVATALERIENGQFDLLLSDLGLPDGSGTDVVRAMRRRARELGRDIPSVALSGYGQDEDIQRSKAAGFSEHLVKPVDVDRLLETVRRLTSPEPKGL